MRFLALLFILLTLLIGLVSYLIRISRVRENHKLVVTFAKKFKRLAEGAEPLDAEAIYETLMKSVLRIQTILGHELNHGPYAEFFASEGNRGQILLEVLEQLGQARISDMRSIAVNNYLSRCTGMLEESIERLSSRMRNPLTLFREGIRVFVILPELLVRWASGKSQLERLQQKDGPRARKYVTIAAPTAFSLALFVLLFGWGPIDSIYSWIAARLSELYSLVLEFLNEAFPKQVE